MEKIHWKKVFNSDYLGSGDLEDGKDLVVTIKSVTIKKVLNSDGKETECNVAEFTDPKIKPMILNMTNCKIVKKFANSNFINDWVNIPVQIYVKEDIRAFGGITDGLRIRETQPSINKPKLRKDMPAFGNVVSQLKQGFTSFQEIESFYDITEIREELSREVEA